MSHIRTAGIASATMLFLILAAGGCSPQETEPLGVVTVPDLTAPVERPDTSAANTGGTTADTARPIAAVPASWRVKVPRPWKYIIIHHSATASGCAKTFDRAHRDHGWDELGYHFVINNGSERKDGLIEVGPRWTKQKHGAHCKTPDNEFNDFGIGICLVGDFSRGNPSKVQLASLRRLVNYLMTACDIPAANVFTHCDAPGTHTACPGRAFHEYFHAHFKRTLPRDRLAGGDGAHPHEQ